MNDNSVKKKSTLREYTEALLFALVVALFLRSFVYEPFKIPSDSMVPTLMKGDHIFVNKFYYGLRIPLSKKWFFKWHMPKRGDVIVFIYPRDEKLDFIKRVVGLPGDSVQYLDEKIYVNDALIETHLIPVNGMDAADKRKISMQVPEGLVNDEKLKTLPYYPNFLNTVYFLEKLGERWHYIQWGDGHFQANREIKVPADHLLVMGDNRDNSSDSREWGFVPMKNVKGRADVIWLSWDYDQGGIRFSRFGQFIR